MKKSSKVLLLVITIMSIFMVMTISSSALTSGDFEYDILDDGTAKIVGYSGTSTDIEIPSIIDDYTVTTIGDYAFQYCTSLQSITIPKSIISIDNFAFSRIQRPNVYGPLYMENVYYTGTADDWTKIPFNTPIANPMCFADYEYFNGELVTDVVLSEGITSINSYAFYDCDSLQSVTIPDSVTLIGYEAFFECNLENVIIGNGVTSLDGFDFDENLKLIKIGNSVTTIGDSAFYECTSLQSITIGDGVTSIGDYAFSGCTGLQNMYYTGTADDWAKISFDSSSSNPMYYAENEYFNGELVTDVVLSEGITNINNYAFYNCTSLQSITIPDSVTSIGDYAFWYCTSLQSITIPDSVTSIGYCAFRDCTSLQSVTIGDGVTTIGDYAFYNCTSLQSITIGDSVTTIGYSAFDVCYYSSRHIYYKGTQSQWNKIDISYNRFDATIHYHYGKAHTFNAWKVTAKATCTATGKQQRSCTECDYVETKTIAKLGHNYSPKYIIDKPATSRSDGSKSQQCTRCDLKGNVTTIYSPKTFTLSTTKYTYNGKVKKPSVTVKDSKGNTLKKDVDYTVKYESGRKKPGKYTVTITFKGNYTGTKKLYFTIIPKAPTDIKVSQTTSTITLKWNKVVGADGYRVYKYNTKTKKYEKLKDVSGTSIKISKLKAGTAYKYKVKAYTKDDGVIWGVASKEIATATKCKTPKITKLTTSNGKANIAWSNVSGESGYQVYYSTKKDSGYKKLGTYKANKVKTSKKLTKGKTYYFKVRAYKTTDNGTVYSSWSSVKKIKIK